MTEKKTTAATDKRSADAGQAEIQAKFDEAEKKGYFGEVPDGPPNEEFTLKGQAKK